MRLFGKRVLIGYYPVQTRDQALELVRGKSFHFCNGVVGSAVYLYAHKNLALMLGNWVVECRISFENLAGLSLHSNEFEDLYNLLHAKVSMSLDTYNLLQRKVALWSGFDGFLLDWILIAVFDTAKQIQVVKASPKQNTCTEESKYNKFWKGFKAISKALRLKHWLR